MILKHVEPEQYFDELYANPNWQAEWDFADKRLMLSANLIDKAYPKHLDIGCADGTFTKFYLQRFPKTKGWGTDISSVVCERAALNCPEGKFEPASAYELPYKDNFFDMVHSAETIEHLEFFPKAVSEIRRILKKGGVLYMTIPAENEIPYEEHIWKWNEYGVRTDTTSSMKRSDLVGFEVLNEYPNFFQKRLCYIKCKKL